MKHHVKVHRLRGFMAPFMEIVGLKWGLTCNICGHSMMTYTWKMAMHSAREHATTSCLMVIKQPRWWR